MLQSQKPPIIRLPGCTRLAYRVKNSDQSSSLSCTACVTRSHCDAPVFLRTTSLISSASHAQLNDSSVNKGAKALYAFCKVSRSLSSGDKHHQRGPGEQPSHRGRGPGAGAGDPEDHRALLTTAGLQGGRPPHQWPGRRADECKTQLQFDARNSHPWPRGQRAATLCSHVPGSPTRTTSPAGWAVKSLVIITETMWSLSSNKSLSIIINDWRLTENICSLMRV